MPKRHKGAQPRASEPAEGCRDRLAVLQPQCREDLRWWTREQPRIADRIWNLIEEVMRSPFTGTGKPEPLRFLSSDVWSRRISQEHRLVYLVRQDRIDVLQARHHYGQD